MKTVALIHHTRLHQVSLRYHSFREFFFLKLYNIFILNLFVDQLASIRNVTLAGLICNNFDLYSIQPKAFLVTTVSG